MTTRGQSRSSLKAPTHLGTQDGRSFGGTARVGEVPSAKNEEFLENRSTVSLSKILLSSFPLVFCVVLIGSLQKFQVPKMQGSLFRIFLAILRDGAFSIYSCFLLGFW